MLIQYLHFQISYLDRYRLFSFLKHRYWWLDLLFVLLLQASIVLKEYHRIQRDLFLWPISIHQFFYLLIFAGLFSQGLIVLSFQLSVNLFRQKDSVIMAILFIAYTLISYTKKMYADSNPDQSLQGILSNLLSGYAIQRRKYISWPDETLNFHLKVEHFFVFIEKVTIETNEIIEKCFISFLICAIMLELRIDFFHNFKAVLKIQADLWLLYFLETICMDLLARIIEIMKFYFSHLVFSQSFRTRNRYEVIYALVTSFILQQRYATCSQSSSIGSLFQFYQNKATFLYCDYKQRSLKEIIIQRNIEDEVIRTQHHNLYLYTMDKIYEYEDKIEEAKFLLSALKIETAFLNIVGVFDKKIINYQRTFIEQLMRNRLFKILKKCEGNIQKICQTRNKIQMRLKRRAFQFIVIFSEREERKNKRSQLKDESFNKMMAISVIDEEDWRQKLTVEELELHCRYYREKIDQVEKSFSEFFKVIKKD